MMITSLKGISDKRAALYGKLGVFSVSDLLSFYPRDYIDYTEHKNIIDTEIGEYAVIKAIVSKKLKPYIGSKVNLYKLILSDESGEILCNIWGNEYSFKSLFAGKEYLFYGKIDGSILAREISNPLYITIENQEKIIPKYPLTKGLTSVMIANNMKDALEMSPEHEPFSKNLMTEYGLISRAQAVREIHFPKSMESIAKARKRLIFEELLILQLGLLQLKNRNRELTSFVFNEDSFDLDIFYRTLSFSPTNAQKRAINECIHDMKGGGSPSNDSCIPPMNRLLQGDVGSGKTLVCSALCYFAAKNGCQSAIMVPTEILANQHFKTLEKMLSPLGLKTVLLTGGINTAHKRTALSEISDGIADVVIGTQALIQSAVEFNNLGLVITDEQHRFGVGQRGKLIKKGKYPHLLIMSATPIPRTLALIIYGDLDLSVLDEMPKGRIPIRTYGVDGSYRERLYKFIIKNINEGRQAFIVCPIVEPGATSSKTSAIAYYEELKNSWFKNIPIGLLHGRMKESEKNTIMQNFANGKISLLISTTVIEVGIDVPNANIILIENAEQFGLSQLHQLRGRVGRSDIESHCILLSDSLSAYTKARIDTMVKTCDGFKIASEDLSLRGPGDFFGTKQHGLPPLKIADMSKDVELINQVRVLADKILKDDKKLKSPKNQILKNMVKELFKNNDEYGFN